jgi:hypothetical protein
MEVRPLFQHLKAIWALDKHAYSDRSSSTGDAVSFPTQFPHGLDIIYDSIYWVRQRESNWDMLMTSLDFQLPRSS